MSGDGPTELTPVRPRRFGDLCTVVLVAACVGLAADRNIWAIPFFYVALACFCVCQRRAGQRGERAVIPARFSGPVTTFTVGVAAISIIAKVV